MSRLGPLDVCLHWIPSFISRNPLYVAFTGKKDGSVTSQVRRPCSEFKRATLWSGNRPWEGGRGGGGGGGRRGEKGEEETANYNLMRNREALIHAAFFSEEILSCFVL